MLKNIVTAVNKPGVKLVTLAVVMIGAQILVNKAVDKILED